MRVSSISSEYNMNTRIFYVCIKYSMFDLIFDVTSCCVGSCDAGKITVYDKIVIENQKKRENTKIKEIVTLICI